MPHALAQAIEIATTALAVAGMGYFLAAMAAARVSLHQRQAVRASFAPGVSILKSLKGLDPGMMDAFRSHCRQSYAGEFELLFGVASLDDPAVAAAEQLQAEFPERAIRLVECPQRLGTNGKVSTLAQLVRHAQYDFLLINDSDITVSPRYLEQVMCCFASPPFPHEDAERMGQRAVPVGLVTALYRGRAHGSLLRGGLPSRLEALGIATDFMAGVLLSKMIEGGLHYGLGSTLAVRREALEKIGGLLPLVDHLADDYELGARVAQAGYRVDLSAEVVETGVPAYGWRGFFEPPVALAADGARRAPIGLCGHDLYARAGLGDRQRAGQRIEPRESVAAGVELFPAAGASHDGRRRGAGRSWGAAESMAASTARCDCDGAVGVRVRGQYDRVARRAVYAQGWKAATSRLATRQPAPVPNSHSVLKGSRAVQSAVAGTGSSSARMASVSKVRQAPSSPKSLSQRGRSSRASAVSA